MIKSIAKDKIDKAKLIEFLEFEGEITDIKTHGFHLFVMHKYNRTFKIKVFDTTKGEITKEVL